MVWSWKKILVSVGCSCTLFMLTTLVSSDQNIFAKMEAITMDFRSFHRIYHEKKVLAESLDQVIMDKRKEEETLEGIITSKQGQLGEHEKKRKRRESENVLYFGGGRVKRVKLSQQLKDARGDVKELSARIESSEEGLSFLDDSLSSLQEELEALQSQVDGLLETQ